MTTRAAAAKTRAQIAVFNRYYSSTNSHGSMAGWGPNPLDKLWDTYVAPRDPPVLQVRRFCDDLRHRRWGEMGEHVSVIVGLLTVVSLAFCLGGGTVGTAVRSWLRRTVPSTVHQTLVETWDRTLSLLGVVTLAAVVLAGAAVVLVMAFAEQLSSPHSALGVTHQSTTPY